MFDLYFTDEDGEILWQERGKLPSSGIEMKDVDGRLFRIINVHLWVKSNMVDVTIKYL